MEHSNIKNQKLFRTLPSKCSYLDGKKEQRLFFKINSENNFLFSDLMKKGFRRNFNLMYLPVCENCNSCISSRIEVKNFSLKKSQKRNLLGNRNISFTNNSRVTKEVRYKLFKNYSSDRHPDGQMKMMTENEFNEFVFSSPVGTEIHDIINEKGIYLGSILLDRLKDGLSAVYSFYDPTQKKKGLGIFMILKSIELIQKMGLEYLYLGYWIKESTKMNYKSNFKNFQILVNGKWIDYISQS